jgi:hypothetical protein
MSAALPLLHPLFDTLENLSEKFYRACHPSAQRKKLNRGVES